MMRRLIKAELYKLAHDKSFFAILCLSVLLGSFLILDRGTLTGYESIFATLYNAPLLMLFISVFAALYIGKDFADRTFYHGICAGHRRILLFGSKAIVYILGSNVILLLPSVLCMIFNTLLHGWGAPSVSSDGGNIIALFLITFLLNTAMSGISLIAAFVCKDIGKSLAISALFYFMNVFVLNSSNAVAIARFIPLGQLRLLLEQPSAYGTAILVGLIFSGVTYLAANYIFNVSDFK